MAGIPEMMSILTHNTARAQKLIQPLQWYPDLAREAQAYAEVLASSNKMQHSGVGDQGENLFMWSSDASYQSAVQFWLAEEKDWHGEKIGEGKFAAYGHYTQCMWRDTTHFGMGKARARNGATYIVARYWPQGNMQGEKPF